jgi:PKD repeat protein
VTIQNILGSSYPSQALKGSQYQTSSTTGGIPNKRALSPPCTITNINGQTISSFVQINGVTLQNYLYETRDCATSYDAVNGGGLYPSGETLCDSTGNIFAVGTSSGYVHIEIDRDWMAAGNAGPSTTYDNNNTIANVKLPCTISSPCSSTVSVDVQGFVYWDPEGHWELHPLTAWRLSSSTASVSASFTWSPSNPLVGQQVAFTASATGGTPPYVYNWNFGDNTTISSSNSTVLHVYTIAGTYTVSLTVTDSVGQSGSASNKVTVTVSALSVNFNWSPKAHNLGILINFTSTVSGGVSPYSYTWSFGDGSTLTTSSSTVTHTYTAAGTYTVALAVKDSSGGLASTSKQVKVRT